MLGSASIDVFHGAPQTFSHRELSSTDLPQLTGSVVRAEFPWLDTTGSIAIRLAQRHIQPASIIAWSLWRRAHQATPQKAHMLARKMHP